MPLPSSPNSISANQISQEFGKNSPFKLGDYRNTTSIGGINWPFDENIPTSGEIKFSDFHGKQLNIVALVDGVNGNRKKITSVATFNIVGELKTSTNSSVRSKSKNIVYIINSTIGSSKSNRNHVALKTGTASDWYGGSPNGGKIIIRVGEEAFISGAGGNASNGTRYENDASNGGVGSSGLGLEVAVESISVTEDGTIRAGGGGGAGGGGAREDSLTTRRAGGGGGGGGSGIPAGLGALGDKPEADEDESGGTGGASMGLPGGDGEATTGGDGGDGGNNDSEARGGGGGGGGSPTNPGEKGGSRNDADGGGSDSGRNGEDGETTRGGNGGNGEGDKNLEADGGNGGANGYSIISNSGISINIISGSSKVKGSTNPGGGVS